MFDESQIFAPKMSQIIKGQFQRYLQGITLNIENITNQSREYYDRSITEFRFFKIKVKKLSDEL